MEFDAKACVRWRSELRHYKGREKRKSRTLGSGFSGFGSGLLGCLEPDVRRDLQNTRVVGADDLAER